MSDKRLTAVDVLSRSIADIFVRNKIPVTSKILMELSEAEEQAKALEREQIEEAYDEGTVDAFYNDKKAASKYFTKTYGDEN